MDRRQRNVRIILWTLFNLFLIVAIVFVLDFYDVWSVSDYYNDFVSREQVSEERDKADIFLLRRNELDKLDKSLLAREQIISMREKAIGSLQDQIDNVMLQLKIKTDQLEEGERRLGEKYEGADELSEKVKEQANKIENMPPAQAVSILEGLPTLEVIAIFRQMDKSAEELGRSSIVSYLISLISAPPYGQEGGIEGGRGNTEKAREIVRLMGKYSKDDFVRIGGGIQASGAVEAQ